MSGPATVPLVDPGPATVPLVDLAWQHAQVAEEVAAGWARVLDTTSFVQGPAVAAFEEAFAEWSGRRFCVSMANGTDALELAVRAAGIGPGDEVLVPANSFVASAVAVSRAGATPCFVDVDADTALIDPVAVAAAVTERTKAVMPVHLYGQVAPMAAVAAVADEHGLAVIEDGAQSHGATQRGQAPGAFGQAVATSFYPGKNLGAYGDGGAVLTDDEDLAARLRALRNYGSEDKYSHDALGFNSRLDTLQAVVLSAKLARLDDWNDQRRDAARRYEKLLSPVDGVVLPVTAGGNEHVWHLFVVQVEHRDAVLAALRDAGVGAGVHYPLPIHLQPAYAGLGYGPGDFPVAERLAARILSLPLYPGISEAQQERVAAALAQAVSTQAVSTTAE